MNTSTLCRPPAETDTTARAAAIKILERAIGPDAVPQWLGSRQPAFGDITAGAMLQRDPHRILRHLQWLEASLDDDLNADRDDAAAADPIHDHRPVTAPKHKVNKVLSILDNLERENPNRRFIH